MCSSQYLPYLLSWSLDLCLAARRVLGLERKEKDFAWVELGDLDSIYWQEMGE